ncbi:hypothetical protein BDQ17DRAFT_1422637 [Cyathus striatus]|nr:hypothetical protein BDQ17DRAFT_1422637 [Cyathus striatus]
MASLSPAAVASASPHAALHVSRVVSRKQNLDQMFADNWDTVPEDDLFSDPTAKNITKKSPPPPQKAKVRLVDSSRGGVFPQGADVESFDAVGTEEEDLERIVELFPVWKETRCTRDVPGAVVDLFVRRCIQLETPQTALAVFGDYQKYHLKLSLNSAQALMYNLSQSHSVKEVLLLASYYDLYKLTPVEQDPTSCAVLASALIKDGSKASLELAKSLVPKLQKALKRVGPVEIPKTTVERAKEDEKWKVWLRWAVRSVDKWVAKADGERNEWLVKWRTESGHIGKAGVVGAAVA